MTKNQDINHYSKWKEKFKNVGGTAGKLAGMTLQSIAPGIHETSTCTMDSLRDTRTFISKSRNQINQQTRLLQSGTQGRKSRDIIKDAFNDIRNGTFSISKVSNSSYDLEDDFDAEIRDFNTEFTNATDPNERSIIESKKSSAKLGKTIAHGNAGIVRGLNQMSNTISTTQLKATQAQTNQITNMMLLSLNNANAANQQLGSKLDAINGNFINLINFQRDNIEVMNQKTENYQNQMLEMMRSLGDSITKMHDLQSQQNHTDDFDFSSGFNARTYIDMVKKNFNGSMLGMGVQSLGMLKSMSGMMGGSPLEMIAPMVLGGLVPKKFKMPIGRMDKMFTRGMENLIYRIGDMRYSDNTLKAFFGELFGKDIEKIGNINLGKYKKEAMSWNGVAQKYLTEVIPSYLAKIESGVNGTDTRYFNNEKGYFQTEKSLKKSLKRQYQDAIGFSSQEMVERLNEVFDQFNIDDAKRDLVKNQINNSIYNSISSKDGSTYGRIQQASDEIGSVLQSVGIAGQEMHDVVNESAEAMKEAMKSLQQTISQINETNYVHLFNQEGKNDFGRYMKKRGNIFGNTRYNSSGVRLDDLTDEERRRAELEYNLNEDLENNIVRQLSRRLLGDDFENKFLYKAFLRHGDKLDIKRRNEKAMQKYGRIIGRPADAMYDALSGFQYTHYDSEGDDRRTIGGPNPNQPRITSRPPTIRRVRINENSFTDALNQPLSAIESRARRTSQTINNLRGSAGNQHGPNSQQSTELTLLEHMQDNEDSLRGMVLSLHDNFLAPMSGGLLGQDGFLRKVISKENLQDINRRLFDEENGIFKGMGSWFKDQMDYIKHVFTGKPYTDRQGNKHDEKSDSVFDHLTNGYDWVYKKTMTHLYGENFEENEDFQRTFGSKLDLKAKREKKRNERNAVTDATEQAAENIVGASEEFADQIVGDVSDENINREKKKMNTVFSAKLKKILPAGLAAGIVGGGIGLLTKAQGTGLLGSLFFSGGPVAGAVLGISAMLLSRSEKFKNVLFGEKDEDGKRTNGLISKKTQEFFKKNAPLLVGGAALGAIKGLFKSTIGSAVVGGPGGFLLNTLMPGGIIGGAVMGLGLSILKNNDRFNEILFGDKDAKKDKKKTGSIGQRLSHAFSKSKGFLKSGAKGLAIGAGSGIALGQMGMIGNALAIGGPVGMGLMGLGIGIASQTDRFKRMLWGDEEVDKDGNPTGKRFGGIANQMRNFLVAKVFDPLKQTLQDKTEDFAIFLKKNISIPFKLAFGPVIDSFREIKKDISDTVKNVFENVGSTITSAVKATIKTTFKPVTLSFKLLGQGIANSISAGAKLALMPASLGLNAMAFGTRHLRKKAMGEERRTLFRHAGDIASGIWNRTREDWRNDTRDYSGPLGGINRFLTHGSELFTNVREGVDAAKAGYRTGMSQQGYNSLGWMSAKDELKALEKRKKELKTKRSSWKKIDSVRDQLMSSNNFNDFNLSTEGLKDAKKKLKAAGMTDVDNLINTNEDLNKLLYNKTDFLDELSGKKGKAKINVAPATSRFYSDTKDYQQHVMSKFDLLTKEFMKFATQQAIERKKKVNIKDLKSLDKNLKDSGLTWDEIGIDPANLVKMNSISDEDYDAYLKDKEEGKDTTGFSGFIRNILNKKDKEDFYTDNAILNNLEKLNDITLANTKLNAGAQLLNTGASESDIEKAAGFNLGSAWVRPSVKSIKNKVKEARITREKSESEAARLGHKSFQDEDENNKDDESVKDNRTVFEKVTDKGRSVFGTIFGTVGKAFTLSFGKKLLVGTAISAMIGPMAREFLGKIVPPVFNVIKDVAGKAFNVITKKLPYAISWLTQNVINNMGFILSNAWKITKTAGATVGKMLINRIVSWVNPNWVPFKDVDNDAAFAQGEKGTNFELSPEEKEIQAEVAEQNSELKNLSEPYKQSKGIYVGEDGDTHRVTNGKASVTGTALRGMIQYNRSGKAKALIGGSARIGRWVAKKGLKIGGTITGIIPGLKLGKHVINGSIKAGEAAVSGGKWIANKVGKKGAERLVEEGAQEAVEQAATKKGVKLLLEKVRGGFKAISNTISKFVKADKWTKMVDSLIKKLEEKIMSSDNFIMKKISKKIAEKTASSSTKAFLGITPLGATFLAYDAINGSLSASYLFGVSQENVTPKMRMISSIMEAAFGSPVGTWLDILFEVMHIVGMANIKQEIARFFYKFLGGEDLEGSITEFEAETAKYNEINNTNLTTEQYNELVNANSTIWGRFKTKLGIGKNKQIDRNKYKVSEKELQNYIAKNKISENTGVSKSKIKNDNLVTENGTDYFNDVSGVAFGPGRRNRVGIVYGNNSQSDPRWANYSLGRFPSGEKSTMATGGCGPTALSTVANAMGKHTNPLSVAQSAKSKGYLKDGGSTSDLFTKGASSMGLNASNVSSTSLSSALKSGNPVILSGKSTGSGPYTEAGHVVVAKGMDKNGNAIVSDPMRGTRSISTSELQRGMTGGWKYSSSSVGYGIGGAEVIGYGIQPGFCFKHNTKWYKTIYDANGQGAYKEMSPGESKKNLTEILVPPNFDPDTALSKNSEEYGGAKKYNKSKSKNYINSGSIAPMESKYKSLENLREAGTNKNTKFLTGADKFRNAHNNLKEVKQEKKKKESSYNVLKNTNITDERMDQMYARDLRRLPGGTNTRMSEAMGVGSLKTASQIKTKIRLGKSQSGGEYGFNTMDFYRGLYVADLESIALYESGLLSDSRFSKFRELYKYFVKSDLYPLRHKLSDTEIGHIFGRSRFVDALGGRGEENGYSYKYGFPFFQTMDERWSDISWRGATVKTRGGDLASLGMILTAYGDNIIDPSIIYDKWIEKHPKWHTESGLDFDQVLDVTDGVLSKKATKVGGKPLKVNKTRDYKAVLRALKKKQPVIMSGWRFKGSPFDGYYSKEKARTSGPDDFATIVGRAANEDQMAVLNPYHTLTQNDVYDPKYLSLQVGAARRKALKDAWIFTSPDGKGISGKVSLNSKKGGTKHLDMKNAKGLDKILALFRNIANIGGGILNALIGDEEYTSIYDQEDVVGEEDTSEEGREVSEDGTSDSSSESDGTNYDAHIKDWKKHKKESESNNLSSVIRAAFDTKSNPNYLENGILRKRTNSKNSRSKVSGGVKTVRYFVYKGKYYTETQTGAYQETLKETVTSNPKKYARRSIPTDMNDGTARIIPIGMDTSLLLNKTPLYKSNIGGGSRDLVFGPGSRNVVYGIDYPLINRLQSDGRYNSYLTNAQMKMKANPNNYSKLSKEEKACYDFWKASGGTTLTKKKKNTKMMPGVVPKSVTPILNKAKKAAKKAKKAKSGPYADAVSDTSSDTTETIEDGEVPTAIFNIPEIQQFNGTRHMEGRPGGIEYLAMHYTTSASSPVGSAKNVCSGWESSSTQASADFVVDDGEIWQYNPKLEKQFCYAVGGDPMGNATSLAASLYKKATNSNVISIEMQSSNKTGSYESDAGSPNWYFTEEVINNSAGLAAKLMSDYNIDSDHLIMHHHVNGKQCPGPWTRNEEALKDWESFKSLVASGGGVSSKGGKKGKKGKSGSNKVDISKLSAGQKLAAYANASIAAMLGDDYETAKKKYLEQAAGGSNDDSGSKKAKTKADKANASGNFSVTSGNVPKTVFDYFISKGYTPAGAAGIMGNMHHESGMIVTRKQSDFSSGYTASAAYTKGVDDGSIPASTFIHDGVGYGLVQFTWWELKQKLLEAAKNRKKSIGDIEVQLDEIDRILSGANYGAAIKSASSPESAADLFLEGYEKPAVYNYGPRREAARSYYNQFAKKSTVKGLGELSSIVYGPGTVIVYGKKKKKTSKDSDSEKNWLQICRDVKQLIKDQNPSYGTHTYRIDYMNDPKDMRADCSGYVGLCLYYYGAKGMINTTTYGYTSEYVPMLKEAGFTLMSWPGKDKLEAGDILIDPSHHVEIYAGNGNVYNCGATDDMRRMERPYYQSYPYIWRPNDPGAAVGTQIGKKSKDKYSDSSFSSDGGSSEYMDPFSSMISAFSKIKLETPDGTPIAFGPGKNNPTDFLTQTLGGRITSGYGTRNTTLGNEYHRGVDIAAPHGQTIYSPISGKVVSKGNDPVGYGNYTVIQDHAGKNHLFAHMKNDSVYGVGDTVNYSDIIGQVGDTGKTTGDHLHYEIRKNGNKYSAIDPTSYKYNSEMSRSMNIHNTNRKLYSDEEAIGTGRRDVNTEVKEKLNVAINTKNIEGKMDTMIEALQLMVDNTSQKPEPATSSITNNNMTTVYGPGGKKVISKTSSTQSSKPPKQTQTLAEIHRAIASRS